MTTDDGIIIVTGSNGRIGDAVMRRFAGRFDHVIGFDRKADNPPPPGCVYVPVDITSDDSVREGLKAIREHHGSRVASFVHLAAYYDFLGEPSPQYEEITVRGTGRLLRGLRDLGFQVEQFVFSSTMLVHRAAEPGQLIDEDSPIEPRWAYPASKVKTEQVIRDGRGDIPAVLLRISGVYVQVGRAVRGGSRVDAAAELALVDPLDLLGQRDRVTAVVIDTRDPQQHGRDVAPPVADHLLRLHLGRRVRPARLDRRVLVDELAGLGGPVHEHRAGEDELLDLE